ncbi:uncharacterized protein CLUP02_10805 [Colletotrichum lupini]|uniref:Uncharacterized protein n=1 Tax=Colletotrichum lupini TaxID=145971 RepID=A0A9Q8SY08_9PEZI|nr:uncharacterized protein CLUP02_10805 [Colletotrichum lupini]UQC85308.1 hypothetical protein CLUP02_10805 [Colletotrichum lupini]
MFKSRYANGQGDYMTGCCECNDEVSKRLTGRGAGRVAEARLAGVFPDPTEGWPRLIWGLLLFEAGSQLSWFLALGSSTNKSRCPICAADFTFRAQLKDLAGHLLTRNQASLDSIALGAKLPQPLTKSARTTSLGRLLTSMALIRVLVLEYGNEEGGWTKY